MLIKSATAAEATRSFLMIATKAETYAFNLGLERAAEFLRGCGIREEDTVCRQLYFDSANEIVALKAPDNDHKM